MFRANPADLQLAAPVANRRQTWGKRALLCVVPESPAPYLRAYYPKASETFLDTGQLPRAMPIHIEVRFADPIIGAPGASGGPSLPFSDVCPAVLGNDLFLRLRLRRGADGLSATTVDEYTMPVGVNNGIPDRVGFDIVTSQNLGLDIELFHDDSKGPRNPASALWVEVVSAIVDTPSKIDLIEGYNGCFGPRAYAASAASVLLAPARNARRQLFITNTSASDLWVAFAETAFVTLATFCLPGGQNSVYESPIGGYAGPVSGIWNAVAPTGLALVTEGVDF